MIVGIHQPEHLVWTGFLDKVSKSDVFVLLDNVQFEKNNFQNRNKIADSKGWKWLTVPVKKHSLNTPINEVEIANQDWKTNYLDSIMNTYKESPNFKQYFLELEGIINQPFTKLVDLNVALIFWLLKKFNIKTKIVFASDLDIPKVKGGSKLCYEICKAIGADIYLAGNGSKDYLDPKDFPDIEIRFQDFTPPHTLSAIHSLYV
jgi:hypothetical protein